MLRSSRFILRTPPRSSNPWSSPAGRETFGPPKELNLKRKLGVEDISLIDRDEMTLTKLMKLGLDASFQPKDADSRSFGGDGSTHRASLFDELKGYDKRTQPFLHENLLKNYLKSMSVLDSPSGGEVDVEVLRGRLVGLLFFTESDRSLQFMRLLQKFSSNHRPDFVVVAISLAGKEMSDITRRFGFFHCSHRHGATWVTRDVGVNVSNILPLPRLVVVDGTSGNEITRSGVTAVVANPEGCFAEWREGDSGHGWLDFYKTIYM